MVAQVPTTLRSAFNRKSPGARSTIMDESSNPASNDDLQVQRVQQVQRRRGARWPWIMVLLFGIGIIVARIFGPQYDFAISFMLTVLFSFLIWIFATIGFMLSNAPRTVWQVLLLTPLLLGLAFIGAFQFIGFDGELRPQFRSRWEPLAILPVAKETGADIVLELAQPRASDFPQFLGPTRDARLSHIALQEDWENNPPSVLWHQPIGAGWSGFAIQGDLAVTLEQRDSEEWVTAYSMLDGSLIWKHVVEAQHDNVMGGLGPRSTPSISDNRVYAVSAVSQLSCLDISTGDPIWSADLLNLAETSQADMETQVSWGRASSPLVTSSRVYVPLGGTGENRRTLIAFDKITGEELWRAGTDQISYSSPMLATLCGVEQVLLVTEKNLQAYAPNDGGLLWSTPWPGNSNADAAVSQPIVIDDSRVLMAKGYGQGAQLIEVKSDGDKWTPNVLWSESSVMRTKLTTGVLHEGYVYGLSDGILECIDVETGERQWKKGRYRHGQLLLVGNHLLISSQRGELVIVRASPDGFEELAKLPVIEGVTWNTLAFSGNRVLIRNSQEVACVELSLKQTKQDESSSPDVESEAEVN